MERVKDMQTKKQVSDVTKQKRTDKVSKILMYFTVALFLKILMCG